MTEREKMIEIVLDTEITGIKIRNITGGISTANAIADALIAAGIGDVKEAEHRAEVVERALDNAVELAHELRTEADTLSCSSCPMFHIFDSCKDRGLYKDCAKRWKEELIKQAE